MNYIFESKGPLDANHPTYIERLADREALSVVLNGDYLHINAPRKIGKTSLLNRLADRLILEGWRCACIDLSTLTGLSKSQWYSELGKSMVEAFTPGQPFAISNQIEMRDYSINLALLGSKGKPCLALMLDGIEKIHVRDDFLHSDIFFMLLRSLYSERNEFEGTFVLVLSGSLNPGDLVSDPSISPFNVGQEVTIEDFDLEQVKKLAHYLPLPGQELDLVAERLYYWTNGHPYLTQQLCSSLSECGEITAETVDEAVDSLLHSRTSHLQSLQKNLIATPNLRDNAQRLITQDLNFFPISGELYQLINVLGLVKQDNHGKWQIRNRIYELYLEIGPIRQEWKDLITRKLKELGEVTQADVPLLPNFAWSNTMITYRNESTLPVVIREKSLRLELGSRLVASWGRALERVRISVESTGQLESEALSQMTSVLADSVGLRPDLQWKTLGSLHATTINGHVLLGRGIPQKFPLIYMPATAISSDAPNTLVSLCNWMNLSPLFSLIIPLPVGEDNEYAKKLRAILHRSPYNFVVLSQDDLFQIFIDPAPSAQLVRCISKQVSPVVVSPFIVRDPVPIDGHMFFGREEEIHNIIHGLSSRSFSVIGNRRIGKSSLLRQLQQLLEQDPRYFVKPVINLQAAMNVDGLYRYLLEDPPFSFYSPEAKPETFRSFVEHLTRQADGRLVVLLIDEPDELLLSDEKQQYRLSAIWRELAQANRCRFVFAGHRALSRIIRDARSPFFNFSEPLPLGYLNENHAKSLLQDPLKNIGFELSDVQAVLDLLWEVSAGHPNVIQWIGRELMKQLSRGDNIIHIHHLEHILANGDFKQEYQDIIWGGLEATEVQGVSPLERAILLLGDPEGFTRSDIASALHEAGFQANPQALRNALAMLTSFSLLELRGTFYTCKVRYLLTMLDHDGDREELLSFYREQVNE